MIQHLILLLLFNWTVTFVRSLKDERCERINMPMCRTIEYNLTSMPNRFQHVNQEEASLEVSPFWPLVQINCSDDLRFFLCSMYFPICMEDFPDPVPACSSVCLRARFGCEPVMKQYGFQWPEKMNCDNFPKHGIPDVLCMDPKNGATVPGYVETVSTTTVVSKEKERIKSKHSRPKNSQKGKDRRPMPISPSKSEVEISSYNKNQCRCRCQSPMIQITDSTDRKYYNVVNTGGIVNCVQPCQGIFFSKQEQKMADFFLTIFASICFVCSILVVFTFLSDSERFRYPERSIIFLSGCYIMVSIGFLVRNLWTKDVVACDEDKLRYPLSEAKPGPCITIFLLIYFFSSAASVWWVILTFTWFLSASLKWSTEAISSYALYFHLSAWFLPAVESFLIVTMNAIDGEPLAGICGVGNLSVDNLMKFVIIPNLFHLLIGSGFLVSGLVSLFRIRNVIRQQVRMKADKLEKLMARIFIFSVLYIVPMSIVIGCNGYDYCYRQLWERNYICPCSSHQDVPYVLIYMLKYIMCLMVGIATCFWILSGKTFESWSKCLKKLCCCSSSSQNTASHYLRSQYITVNKL